MNRRSRSVSTLAPIGISSAVREYAERQSVGTVIVETLIHAPLARCFDLARDIDVHCRTAAFTAERAIPPGRTTGLLELGDQVTFEARHFGVRWRLTARIVEFDPPTQFVDQMVRGPFRSLRHLHEFHERNGATVMVDTLEWESPLGALGRIADVVLLERHLTSFVSRKQRALKLWAEASQSQFSI
jgi:ligand-binding SRPBCC domain-containing protein